MRCIELPFGSPLPKKSNTHSTNNKKGLKYAPFNYIKEGYKYAYYTTL